MIILLKNKDTLHVEDFEFFIAFLMNSLPSELIPLAISLDLLLEILTGWLLAKSPSTFSSQFT